MEQRFVFEMSDGKYIGFDSIKCMAIHVVVNTDVGVNTINKIGVVTPAPESIVTKFSAILAEKRIKYNKLLALETEIHEANTDYRDHMANYVGKDTDINAFFKAVTDGTIDEYRMKLRTMGEEGDKLLDQINQLQIQYENLAKELKINP